MAVMVDTNHNIKYLASSGGSPVIPWCYDTGVKYYCLYDEQEEQIQTPDQVQCEFSTVLWTICNTQTPAFMINNYWA